MRSRFEALTSAVMTGDRMYFVYLCAPTAISVTLFFAGCAVYGDAPKSWSGEGARDSSSPVTERDDARAKQKDAGVEGDGCKDAVETCDGQDNDCDGETDEAPASELCQLSHAEVQCEEGRCVLKACRDLFGDCDGNVENGCETPLDTIDDCGQCGRSCHKLDHAVGAGCIRGACVFDKCEVGYGDCDGDKLNGCEQKVDTLNHCGACGRSCAGKVCAGGVCTQADCPEGFADCDGKLDNGCEASLKSVSNCILCSQVCSANNATTSCESGTCQFVQCNPGYGNCDGDTANGCEVPLDTLANCGACGTKCDAAGFCTGGKCTAIMCLPGRADCDQDKSNMCEVFLDSLDNCGICGHKCEQLENRSVSCKEGTCQIDRCDPGKYDCDKDAQNGCESTLKDNKNCGACGKLCTLPNATASCASGQCKRIECNPFFADCDGNESNGCETSLTTATDCGQCKNACSGSYTNATLVCSAGQCGTKCETGFGDCDNDLATNGCETNTNTDVVNCGKCGVACFIAQVCCRGRCAWVGTCL